MILIEESHVRQKWYFYTTYTSSDEIGITHIGVVLTDASDLYQPIHAMK